ncbi:hypothetical protein Hanom_Chr12g01138181 [Helianthus anomalus]
MGEGTFSFSFFLYHNPTSAKQSKAMAHVLCFAREGMDLVEDSNNNNIINLLLFIIIIIIICYKQLPRYSHSYPSSTQ